MQDLEIEIIRLDEDLPLPKTAHFGDGGLDLYATQDDLLDCGERKLIGTGISIAIPIGYCGLITPRSGLALKHGITIVNSPGLIDASYRGEIKVVLLNTDLENLFAIQRGDRIAQLVIQPVYNTIWKEVETLSGPDRGGGFGHSGR
jgi:dUTP pyrophosphatase